MDLSKKDQISHVFKECANKVFKLPFVAIEPRTRKNSTGSASSSGSGEKATSSGSGKNLPIPGATKLQN